MAVSQTIRGFRSHTATVATAASMAAALIWVLLAWRSPTSTFHFAPIVIVLAGPFVTKQRSDDSGFGNALIPVGASGLTALAALALLALAGKLEGPTFWSDDGAGLEAAAFIGASAIVGFVALVGRSSRPPS
jgi:hypothetical protein